jgi:predicted transcriptional regulator
MPSIRTNLTEVDLAGARLAPLDPAGSDSPVDWRSLPKVSDDECLALLARAVRNHDPESLDEVAWLIGRLAVPIE